jgi:hypothetical protein
MAVVSIPCRIKMMTIGPPIAMAALQFCVPKAAAFVAPTGGYGRCMGTSVPHNHWLSLAASRATAKDKDDDDSCIHVEDERSSFWKKRPGESERSFFQRVQQAASNPVTFERVVMGQEQELKQQQRQERPAFTGDKSNTADAASADTTSKGYQRVEEWEAAQCKEQKQGNNWYSKVQFDGLRHGNRLRQDDILRRNLKQL